MAGLRLQAGTCVPRPDYYDARDYANGVDDDGQKVVKFGNVVLVHEP